MKKVFPDKEWVELNVEHKIFNVFYHQFNDGLPKIHDHDNKKPKGFSPL